MGLKWDGGWKSENLIFSYNLRVLGSSKGTQPQTIAYNIIPLAQISVFKP